MTFTITCRTLNNSRGILKLQVTPTDTVQDLKHQISDGRMEDGTGSYSLIYNGQVLPDSATMSTAGISSEGYVIVIASRKKLTPTNAPKRGKLRKAVPDENDSADLPPPSKKCRNDAASSTVRKRNEDILVTSFGAGLEHNENTEMEVDQLATTSEDPSSTADAPVGTPFDMFQTQGEGFEGFQDETRELCDLLPDYQSAGELLSSNLTFIPQVIDLMTEQNPPLVMALLDLHESVLDAAIYPAEEYDEEEFFEEE